jgi:D-serine deaminase-like pyridoxal phosphate-dependent protein
MVDHPEQLPLLEARAREHGVVYRVAIDLDLSTRYFGLHFGAWRSAVVGPEGALELARAIALRGDTLRLVGLMGYEAQLAGVPDETPSSALRGAAVRGLKALSRIEVAKRRGQTTQALRAAGFTLEFVNGGGTGSLESTREDLSVTEVSAGSGLYSPRLFDGFRAFRGTPALYFALPVTRRPAPDIVTCSFGGYAASGPGGPDRAPSPALPKGLALLPHEGAGEVQTPVRLPAGLKVALGDPLFFRHAKAGELAERFARFLFVRKERVVSEICTYRGDGQCFF